MVRRKMGRVRPGENITKGKGEVEEKTKGKENKKNEEKKKEEGNKKPGKKKKR